MNTEWLFYLIYPGHQDCMDGAIREVVAPAVLGSQAIPGVNRWFFLRYVDQRGLHLRLRFRGSTEAMNTLHEQVEALLHTRLPWIANNPGSPLRRLVPLPQSGVAPSGYVGHQLDIYEPEYAKYGGEPGVEIAEALFEESSRIALRYLEADACDMSTRAALALQLMAASVESALEDNRWDLFWDHYAFYWSGGDRPNAEALRKSFIEAALKRKQVIGARCRSLLENPIFKELITQYRTALTTSFAQARALQLAPSSEELCFQFIHLMNNRLGIMPLEEAYLAALLRQVRGGELQALA